MIAVEAKNALAFCRHTDTPFSIGTNPTDAVGRSRAPFCLLLREADALKHWVVSVEPLVGANPNAAEAIFIQAGRVVALKS